MNRQEHGDGDDLHCDWDGSDKGVRICQNSSNCALQICANFSGCNYTSI